MKITDIATGDISGFGIGAWIVEEDGDTEKYELIKSGKIITEFPKEIECNGMIYKFEDVELVGLNKDHSRMGVIAQYG